MTDQWIKNIVARATPLWDRQVGNYWQNEVSLPNTNKRLDRWRKVLGSELVLTRRMGGVGTTAEALKQLLKGEQSEPILPSWALVLSSVLSEYSSIQTYTGNYNTKSVLPFEEILLPFLFYGRERIKAEAGLSLDIFLPSAMHKLEHQLMAHLTFIASLTLGQDFYKFRFEYAPSAALESVWKEQNRSTTIYSMYVKHMQAGGLRKLLYKYPVLARLLCQSVEQWIAVIVTFSQRFLDDFSVLSSLFHWNITQPQQAIESLQTDLSDRHYGGQTVAECMLYTGEKIIYKPRSVRPECAFYKFIDKLNKYGLSLDLRIINMLDRSNYGWVESIPYQACQSEAEVKRFYQRAGMLLAISYSLSVTDIHCENLIANGEHPVIIDLETILSKSAPQLLDRMESESVLRTGFLPRLRKMPDTDVVDLSALGADETQNFGIPYLTWQSINTDQMAFSESIDRGTPTYHRVRLGNTLPPLSNNLTEFLAGFKEAYYNLLKHREELLNDELLLKELNNLELRIILRSTITYTHLHLHLLHPEFLKDGLDRSLELEWLARPVAGPLTPNQGRILIYEHERRAMEKLDIPHFTTSLWKNIGNMSDDEDLRFLSEERNSNTFKQNLSCFNPINCAEQMAIIQQAVKQRFGEHIQKRA